ncbi:MAG: Membrane MotB of proton-channel complex MotA/MotB, partial [Bacteroidota bacterium]
MRKNRHESESHEEGEDEGWLMTYADTITTLLGFFIMLVSLSNINMGKFQQATSSVRAK